MDTKRCPNCGRTLPFTIEHFYLSPSTPHGSAYCRPCMRERGNAWQRSNRDKTRRYKKNHYDNHRDEITAYQRSRRTKRKGRSGVHTAAEAAAQVKRQRGRCFYCGERLGEKFHMDHVWPVSRGGHSGIENLVASCPTCNLKKKDKTPMEFAGILL